MAGNNTTNAPPSVNFPQIPQFQHDPTNPSSAARWLQQVEIKFSLVPNLTETQKVALVNSVLDGAIFDRVARALLPEDVTTFADWAKFKDVFINLFDIKRSLFADRYKAFQIEWLGPAHEPWQEYVARVRQSVALFDGAHFDDNELSTLLLLMGMKAPALEALRSLLLNALIKTPRETLANVSTLVDNALMTERDQKLPEQSHINFVKSVGHKNKPAAGSPKPPPRTPCPACGGAHWKSDCRFKEATCHTCGTKGHISKVCKEGAEQSVNVGGSNKKVRFVNVMSITVQNGASLRRPLAATINGTSIQMQYDSGSDITILTRKDYQNVGAPTLTPTHVRACGVDGQPLKLDGYFTSEIACEDGSKVLDIHVADVHCSLLGLDFCDNVKLIVADANAPKPMDISAANIASPSLGLDICDDHATNSLYLCSSIVSSPSAEVTQPQSIYDSTAGQYFSSPTENIPPESAAALPLASNGSAKVIAAVSQLPIDNTQKELAPLIVPALGQFADAKDEMDECLSTHRINTIVTAPVTAQEINAALAEDVTATLRDKGKRMSGINFGCFSDMNVDDPGRMKETSVTPYMLSLHASTPDSFQNAESPTDVAPPGKERISHAYPMKLQHVPTPDSHQLHEPSDDFDFVEELSPLVHSFKEILHAGESSSNVAAQHPPPAQHSRAPPQHFKFNRPKKKPTV